MKQNKQDIKMYTKNEVISLMELARDKGERDGVILWSDWLKKTFINFDKNVKSHTLKQICKHNII